MVFPTEEKDLQAIATEFKIEISPIVGEMRTIYAIIDDEWSNDLIKHIEGLEFIEKVNRIQAPFKLLSRQNE